MKGIEKRKEKIVLKKILAVLLCVTLLGALSVLAFNRHIDNKIERLETDITPLTVSVEDLPVEEMQMCYAFDVFDKEKMVGFVDYMFIAKIEGITGTIYEGVVYNPEKNEYSGLPYTCYEVTVIENIKGNLVLNQIIPFRKLGGVSIDGNTYYKYDPENSPQVGNYYLFLGYADKNGELYAADPNSAIYLGSDSTEVSNTSASTLSLNNSTVSQFGDDGILGEYRSAYENQDLSERIGERHSSVYDAS